MKYEAIKGGTVDGFALIKSIACKVNVKGLPYLDMTLCDKDSEINAKLWDYKEETHGKYEANDFIKFRASLSQYNGAEQLKIEKIRHVTEVDNVNMSDYVPTAEYSSEMMFTQIFSVAESFKDEDLKLITKTILMKHKSELLIWPAAFRLHHAMRGGLLYHTLSIIKMAEQVALIYPSVDRDLLLSGVILHDIAKIQEFEVGQTGIATSYSIRGNLLGHLVMGAMEIKEEAEKLNISEKTATLLEHMLISHHGVPEFGAAVRPLFIEAEVLSQLDTLDATIYEMAANIGAIETDAFTQRIWALDDRKLYNHGRIEVKPVANLDK